MHWLTLTALSVITRAIYGILTKILSKQTATSPYTQSALTLLWVGLITFAISPLLGGIDLNLTTSNLCLMLLVILGQGVGTILYFTALKHLTSGTAQITSGSTLIFNALLSTMFLNLHLSFLNIFGVTILMLAIFMIINGKIEMHYKGVTIMIIAALLFTIFQLSSAELASQMSTATYLLIVYLGSALVTFLIKGKTVIFDIKAEENHKRLMVTTVFIGLFSLANVALAFYAYKLAPEPTRVAMLLPLQVVFAVFLSYFVLNERKHLLRKTVAAILVVVAAVMIKS